MKNNRFIFSLLFLGGFFLLPLFVHAQVSNTTLQGVGDFKGFVGVAVNILNQFAVMLIGVAVFIIIWGLFRYIVKIGQGDTEGGREGLRFVTYGVIGVFIMISFWGFVNLIRNTFYLNSPTTSLGAPSSTGGDTGTVKIDNSIPPNTFCPGAGAPSPDNPSGCYE
jgi:hypothetical protein